MFTNLTNFIKPLLPKKDSVPPENVRATKELGIQDEDKDKDGAKKKRSRQNPKTTQDTPDIDQIPDFKYTPPKDTASLSLDAVRAHLLNTPDRGYTRTGSVSGNDPHDVATALTQLAKLERFGITHIPVSPKQTLVQAIDQFLKDRLS